MGRVFDAADLEPMAAQPTAKGGARVFDSADLLDPNTAQAPISKATSFVRGAAQGLTLGFADEIAGALESAFTSKTYKQARDESRTAFKAAQEANPKTFLAGEIGGGVAGTLVPGLGVARGAGMVARAAASGAISGLGASEADSVGGMLLDTAKGGAIGGVLGAAGGKLSRAISGAPARAEAAALGHLKEGIQNSTKVKVFGRRGEFEQGIKQALDSDKPIKRLVRTEPKQALDAVDTKLTKLGDKLDEFYDKAQDASRGVPVPAIMRAMHKVEQEYAKTAATKPLADQVGKAIENFRAIHAEKNVHKQVGHVSFQDLRAEYRAFQDKGHAGTPMFDVPIAKQLWRDVSNAMREVLHEHIDKVAQRNPSLGIDRMALARANKEMSSWLRVQQVLDEKVTRETAKAFTLSQLLSRNAVVGVAREGARKAGEAADVAIAPAVRAAQRHPKLVAGGTLAADATARIAGQQAPEVPAHAGRALANAISPEVDDGEDGERPEY